MKYRNKLLLLFCLLAFITQQSHAQLVNDGKPNSLFEEESKEMSVLKNDSTRYPLLQQIEVSSLVCYLSGCYGSGHPFPSIFLDKKNKNLTVTHFDLQKEFSSENMDDALATFRSAIINHGHEVDSTIVDKEQYIYVNGEKKLFVPIKETYDPNEAKKHFTGDQFNCIYRTRPSVLFDYLSGIGDTDRDYPLMYVHGYKSEARIVILNKEMAEEFKLNKLDFAFEIYKKYIDQK
jgi:hypothetical protein